MRRYKQYTLWLESTIFEQLIYFNEYGTEYIRLDYILSLRGTANAERQTLIQYYKMYKQ
jgi:hypothetical protein